MKTVLSDEKIDVILRGFDCGKLLEEFIRNIEQAVLNSEQVQALKRDVGRINAMEQKRILVTPEYEGGWHAEIYGDQETPIVTGYGDCPRAAIDAAMEVNP